MDARNAAATSLIQSWVKESKQPPGLPAELWHVPPPFRE
jgi:hypothetical protein